MRLLGVIGGVEWAFGEPDLGWDRALAAEDAKNAR
jgi:hypothetical protein